MNFIDLFQNSLPLSTHQLCGLCLDLTKNVRKALVVIIKSFLFLRGKTNVYLAKISTHSKKIIF